MIANGKPVRGIDVPIVKLIPRRERKVGKKYYQRIEASLRAVGLIDPLIVFPQGDSYEILDGCLRYRILLDMGVETVPCLIANEREGFTGNRMVNQLSASQEMLETEHNLLSFTGTIRQILTQLCSHLWNTSFPKSSWG